jgi:hypothetical protein
MPVRAGTVAVSVPDPQNEPGKGRQQNECQIGLSRFPPNPAEKDEKNDGSMKNKKEEIQKFIHEQLSFWPDLSIPDCSS